MATDNKEKDVKAEGELVEKKEFDVKGKRG